MGHAAGSEGWLGHYLTWFVPGVGEFFHFTWDLERKQGPCIWALSHFVSTPRLMPHTSPGWGGGVGVSIDRCITWLLCKSVRFDCASISIVWKILPCSP